METTKDFQSTREEFEAHELKVTTVPAEHAETHPWPSSQSYLSGYQSLSVGSHSATSDSDEHSGEDEIVMTAEQ